MARNNITMGIKFTHDAMLLMACSPYHQMMIARPKMLKRAIKPSFDERSHPSFLTAMSTLVALVSSLLKESVYSQ